MSIILAGPGDIIDNWSADKNLDIPLGPVSWCPWKELSPRHRDSIWVLQQHRSR